VIQEEVDASKLRAFSQRGRDAARVALTRLDFGAVAFDQAENDIKMMDREKVITSNDKYKGEMSFGSAEDFHCGL